MFDSQRQTDLLLPSMPRLRAFYLQGSNVQTERQARRKAQRQRQEGEVIR